VLNAQSANPQFTLGIWENASGHTSNINITNNSFLNDAVGNSPSLNIERAFRVTSHSSATTTVNYTGNTTAGANIGFQWIGAPANFAGNLPVNLIGNTVTNCDTGVLIQSNGVAHLDTDVITGSGAGGGVHVVTGLLSAAGANTNGIFRTFVTGGSGDGVLIDATAGAITDPMTQNDFSNNTGFGMHNLSATNISATLDYWGSNIAATVAAEVSGPVTFDPWLASGTDVSGIVGFQPFIWATTTTVANKTTFIGTGAADTGSMLATSPITLTMDGDTGFVPTAQLLNVDIQLGGSDDVFTLGQTGITPTLFDGGPGNDTLIGTNVAQTWNITGANSGNIPGATSAFTTTESLKGGTAADNFVFSAAGSIAQKLDGNLGTDTLDNTAVPAHSVTPTGPGTLDGFMGTATGVGAIFDNINIVAAPADMSVIKTGPATANAGTVISYTITVTNNGTNPAINATLTDTLPAGTTFASLASPGGWSCSTPPPNSPGSINCSIGSMAVGSAVFTLNINGPVAPASISNTATVSSSSTDNTPGNNSSTANTNVIFTADLSITKTATATAAQGTNVTYNISLTNNGPQPATGVSITDALPANTTFVSTTQNTGLPFNCTNPSFGTNGTVTCTNPATMASGATATFTIIATVSPTAPLGLLNNTANATSTSTDPTTPNTSTAGTLITAGNADISVVKTAAPGPYATGSNLTYTIAVTNGGPTAAANVSVTDVIPVGTTFVSATPTQGSCSGTTTVTCSLGSIANLGSASIALTVTLPSAPGPVANTATVSTTSPDPTPGNNSSTSNITVVASANIPAISPMMLLLLAITLAMAGFIVKRH
ncbi:MAG TPA: hypothetical protein VGQ21_09685, partial [Thermoanaerobaculia bacterium]|jgi:uncharacterized repeat protein (TIGR01451 family)|nr:hypothetical protein [Thermoanaerobaculia bacterium]